MNVALDLGVHEFRTLRREHRRLTAHRFRPVYIVITDTSRNLQTLEQLNIPSVRCDDGLVILGEPAVRVSQLFRQPYHEMLPAGRIDRNDPLSRQMLSTLIESMLPVPASEEDICSLHLPHSGIPSQDPQRVPRTADPDHKLLKHLISLRGYTPSVLSSGMAVVLAEMVATSFTGLGLDIGATSSNAVLAFQGRELAASTTSMGGDWIDERLARACQEFAWDPAGERRLNVHAIEAWKHEFSGDLTNPHSTREHVLSDLYRELLESVVRCLARDLAINSATELISEPVELVYTGGPTRANGFDDLLRDQLRQTPFPLEVQAIRCANSPYTVTRGCLIHAELATGNRTNRYVA
ncbi:MAG: hypothetical protein ABGZ17_03110 [Planctomycetaceae bacterium]